MNLFMIKICFLKFDFFYEGQKAFKALQQKIPLSLQIHFFYITAKAKAFPSNLSQDFN